MNYPKPYFSDIPGVGCLDIDYIFFEAECPILFTCRDLEENLYLCICCDIRDEQRWIISPTTADKLIKLIKNKISLFDAFHSDFVFVAVWKKDYQKEKIEKRNFNDINLQDIPDKEEFLDAEDGEYNDYLEKLHDSTYSISYFSLTQRMSVFTLTTYLKNYNLNNNINDTIQGGCSEWITTLKEPMLLS